MPKKTSLFCCVVLSHSAAAAAEAEEEEEEEVHHDLLRFAGQGIFVLQIGGINVDLPAGSLADVTSPVAVDAMEKFIYSASLKRFHKYFA